MDYVRSAAWDIPRLGLELQPTRLVCNPIGINMRKKAIETYFFPHDHVWSATLHSASNKTAVRSHKLLSNRAQCSVPFCIFDLIKKGEIHS